MVPEPLDWSPDAPHLYELRAVLRRGGEVADLVRERFGFRSIETRAGRIYLNGQPLFLRGALDQDYYPDRICTPPSEAFLEDQFRKAKALGLNCLRCHIKVPDPRYYAVADRVGLLIWTELPNAGRLTAQARARAEATLRGMLERDGNHPSIFCWTIINENWGTDLVHSAEDRAWLRRTVDWLKAADPDRLVVDNSPIAPSFHLRSDLEDFHFYAAIPDHRRSWDGFVEALAARPAWTYGPAAEVVHGDEPLLCSEFGNWGLPDPEAVAGAPTTPSRGGSRPGTTGAMAPLTRTESRAASAPPGWSGCSGASAPSSRRRSGSNIVRSSTRSRPCAGNRRSPGT